MPLKREFLKVPNYSIPITGENNNTDWFKYLGDTGSSLLTLEDDLNSNVTNLVAQITALQTTVATLTTLVNNNTPVGSILTYSGGSVTTGFLLCDGSEVAQADYPTLYALIGTIYGTAVTPGKFVLPDIRGRSLIGAGTGNSLTARTVGDSLGEETHILTSAELAPHTHSIASGQFFGSGASLVSMLGAPTIGIGATGGTTASAGSGTAHNNMQPSLVVTAMIKY